MTEIKIQITDSNERIAKHIWHDCLQCSFRPFVWKFDYKTIQVIETGTAFRVEGNLKGWVKIQTQPNSEKYLVTILPDESTKPIIYKNVWLTNVPDTIDQVISHYRVQYERERIAV